MNGDPSNDVNNGNFITRMAPDQMDKISVAVGGPNIVTLILLTQIPLPALWIANEMLQIYSPAVTA